MKHVPLPADLGPAIDRLETIADQSTHALLTEGPVHPDYELLGLCTEAIHHRRLYDEAHATWCKNEDQRMADCKRKPGGWLTDADNKASKAEYSHATGYESSMARALIKAKKLKATTAAGIFAKALIVRSSKTGATYLAMSLADDLINCPGLRESLWATEKM